jgi:hypothetical protein
MTNHKNKKRLVTATLTLAAASLASVLFTSYASAQCSDCAIYPNRDPFTEGLMVHPATQPSSASPDVNNARAEMRIHHRHHAVKPDSRNR